LFSLRKRRFAIHATQGFGGNLQFLLQTAEFLPELADGLLVAAPPQILKAVFQAAF